MSQLKDIVEGIRYLFSIIFKVTLAILVIVFSAILIAKGIEFVFNAVLEQI